MSLLIQHFAQHQGIEYLLSKICNHSSVSLGSTDWLLFHRCNNGCTNLWKSGYPRLISLKPWRQQNPILFLNIQAPSEIVWFEIIRANHRTQTALTSHIAFTKSNHRFLCRSLFLRFGTIIAIKRYDMKCNTLFCMFLVLLHPPTTHLVRLVGIFTNYIRSLSGKNK